MIRTAVMIRRGAAIAMVVAALGLGPVGPAAGYPPPGTHPPLTLTTVEDRYAASQRDVRAALSAARAAGATDRAATLAALASRQLLEFDARGTGRVVEVLGDLAGADRIAVIVPGSHTTLDTFDQNRGPGGGARALDRQVRAVDPAARMAVVAWLGYRPPQGINPAALTDRLAGTGAAGLRTTVESVRAVNPDAAVSLLCHSYGSVVCGYAVAGGLPVADLVLYGSPGVGAGSAGELASAERVWAGRSAADPIRFVPFVRVAGIGFGTDPVAPEFGARGFAAGAGGHGDYHLPGSRALGSLALIALGRVAAVPGA